MKKSLIFLGIVVALILYLMSGYNRLVRMDETVNAAWAQVENVYQRRLDLIPNLVETVKGYAAHEKETLQSVIEARAKATQTTISSDVVNNPQAMERFQQSQSQLSSALSRLMVVVEKYPDLKANQNFLELQSQLEGTENRITVERRRYNEAAQSFNSAIRSFPTVLMARLAGFNEKAYFKAEAGAATAPKVQF